MDTTTAHAAGISHNGDRWTVDGTPVNAVLAHQALWQRLGIEDKAARVAVLEQLKADAQRVDVVLAGVPESPEWAQRFVAQLYSDPLDSPSTRVVHDVSWDDVHMWALNFLNPHSAFAFAHWLHPEIADWADDDVTLRDLYVGAYEEWTGYGYPDPKET